MPLREADGMLAIAGVRTDALIETYGTPLLAIDLDLFGARVRTLLAACAEHDIEVSYAAKALCLIPLLRRAVQLGLDIDVCSIGELLTAERAGVAPQRLTMHGSGKSEAELRAAREGRVGTIVVDDVEELERLGRGPCAAAIVVRFNTGIEAHTHAMVRTGGDDTKFGIHPRDEGRVRALLRGSAELRFTGLHAHVGSQIADERAFVANAEALMELALPFAREGLTVRRAIVGGGFGIAMTPEASDEELDVPFALAAIARTVRDRARALGIDAPLVGIEPGRTLIAHAGTTLYRVRAIKRQATRTFVVVDGGLMENPRPALYGAVHRTEAAARATGKDAIDATLCGHSCENDELGPIRVPHDLAVGEPLAAYATGAYTYSMAGNYNRFPKPAVIGVEGGGHRLLARRETDEELLCCDAAD